MPEAVFLRRHSRLMRIASMLEADGTTDPESMARELGIGRRTLYRDMDLLRRAGIKLDYSREEGRYRLDSLYMRLALVLSRKEVTVFLRWFTARTIRRTGRPTTTLDRALAKIDRMLSYEMSASGQQEPAT